MGIHVYAHNDELNFSLKDLQTQTVEHKSLREAVVKSTTEPRPTEEFY
jgi:hypothetical protein